jgi:D-arabinose 1-dehydrogenase-like Zn-dependent alcohol dehydrogenase
VTVLSQTLSKREACAWATTTPPMTRKPSASWPALLIICTIWARRSTGFPVRQPAEVDGGMVIVGIPEAPVPPIQRQRLVGARRNLSGSMMGSIKARMLDFCGTISSPTSRSSASGYQ